MELSVHGWNKCLFKCLLIVFECFREHHLKLKLTKCKFFKSKINYLAHHVSKEGIWPSKENLKAVAEFTPSRTYTEIQAFLGLVGYYRQFIKGFTHIEQPLYEHLSGEGASKKKEWVMLTENALGAFEILKKACLKAPVLAFVDFNIPFLLETVVSKLGLGAVLSQKQTDSWYHPVTYASWSLTVHEHNYHSIKLEFSALKWAIVEQFQEYLLWKRFVVRTDNNWLTYIMTTPNLDSIWRCWVESLVGFTFSIEYHKGWDNAAADAQRQVHWVWTQNLWSPSWKESLWEQSEEQMLITQWCLRLMKRYISKSGKLQLRLEPPMYMWTYMWLTGWPLNRGIQYLRWQLNGFPSGKYSIWSIC